MKGEKNSRCAYFEIKNWGAKIKFKKLELKNKIFR